MGLPSTETGAAHGGLPQCCRRLCNGGLGAWLDAQVGSVKVGDANPHGWNGGLVKVPGYDLANPVRQQQRNDNLSAA